MADSKISGLTSGSAVADTDVFPAVETTNVGPVKKTAAQLKTYAQTGVLKASNNLSDVSSASSARTNLGLGTAATQDTGTSINQIVKLDSSAKLPAVDGSQLTNIPQFTSKLSAFATTSATELATVVNGKTGTSDLVFSTSPTLVTPNIGVATATSVNKISFTQPLSGATLTLANGSTLATSGAYGITLAATGTTNVTFPTSGTLATLSNAITDFSGTNSTNLAAKISDPTGSGSLVFAISPTLVTPTIGTATASSINKVAITAPATSATLTLANGSTLATSGAYSITLTGTGATNVTLPTSGTLATSSNKLSAFASTTSSELAGVISDETGSGSLVFANTPTLVTPILGTPTSGTLTNCTGLPVSTGISGLGGNVASFLATPSSANLRAALTDETGTGAAVFADSPTFVDDITLGTQGTTQGAIVLANAAVGSYSTTLKSSNSATAAYTLTLPTTAGTNGYFLQTDGVGNLTWAASGGGGGGGSVAGSNTQVQFNDAGSFGAVAGFVFDKSTLSLTLGVSSTSTGIFKLAHASSAFATSISAGNNSAAWTLTLPTSGGTSGYALTTNGSGTASWSQIAIETGVSGLGTGVATALGVNTGSSGAFVVNGGALGTPASGTLSSCTGLPIGSGVSGLGTGVSTALAVNTGSAGAIVLNGGALGTPSSGTLTNCTSIPVNQATGTLPVANGGTGTSTAFTAGSVVFAGASGTYSQNNANFFWDNTNYRLGINGQNTFDISPTGTGQYANLGVWNNSVPIVSAIGYFNNDSAGGSSVWLKSRSSTIGTNSAVVSGDAIGNLTFRGADGTNYRNAALIRAAVDGTVSTGIVPGNIGFWTANTSGTLAEKMRLDNAGNLGLGVTPSAWVSYNAIQVLDASFASSNGGDTQITANAYSGSGAWTYLKTAGATRYVMDSQHRWFNAPSGTAGAAITFTQAMTLDASGNLGIGTTPLSLLHLKSAAPVVIIETTAARNSNNTYISFRDSTGEAAFLGFGGGSATYYNWNTLSGPMLFGTNNVERARFSATAATLSIGTSAATNPGKVQLYGSTSGSITLQTPIAAGSSVLTLPAATGTVATTGFSVAMAVVFGG